MADDPYDINISGQTTTFADYGNSTNNGKSSDGPEYQIQEQISKLTLDKLGALQRHYTLTAEEIRGITPYRPPPVPVNVRSILRWGKAADFMSMRGSASLGFTVKDPNQDGSGNDGSNRPQVYMTETSRQTTTVRVENPSDSSQYVMVERINVIKFDGSDGKSYTFALNNGGSSSG